MIKAILFDLDGVLVDAKDLHFRALNKALKAVGPEYVISRGEHVEIYEGLPTRTKLRMLTERKELPESAHDTVWSLKQVYTRELAEGLTYDERLRNVLFRLKWDGLRLYCVSNSVRRTVRELLERVGVLDLFDGTLSNEDVTKPKPDPEIYLLAMQSAGLEPSECLVVEDSPVGRHAATASGAFLFEVDGPGDVTYEAIQEAVDRTNCLLSTSRPNVVIPMAGAGSRFEKAGYTFPKPLVEVRGKPMVQVVVENLGLEGDYIFLVREEHYQKYQLHNLLGLIAPGCRVIRVEGLTEGAACTTLLASHAFDNDRPLVIANSDQFMEWNPDGFLRDMSAVDGGIVTHCSTHPKWSFVRLGEDGFVTQVAEKKPISDQATTGVYYWRRGSDYVKYAEQMVRKNIRVNGEFYVAPVFNEAIADGKKVSAVPCKRMWGLGTPEDLDLFLRERSR